MAPPFEPPETGLSDAQAAERLARDGPNRLPRGKPRTLRVIALAALAQPMFLLLLAAAAVYALVGSLADALMLLGSVLVVALIAIYQDFRTERVLETLKELASPRSRVRRGGRVLHIASHGLVRGDVLLVAEGDRLACDAQLTVAHSLAIDESLLSGESMPVRKQAAAHGTTQGAATHEPQHMLYAGTLVVDGDGEAIVSATGAHTTLGRIGSTLSGLSTPPSRVQAELTQLVWRIAVAAMLICLVAAAAYALRQGSWSEGVLVGLTLAMAIVPEEFAVVWTVMMALGAWRLSQHQVLTRQPQAIEALGTTSVLCVDKTGTLTHNRMALLALATPEASAMLGADDAADARFAALLDIAAHASASDGLEPMDRAILGLHQRSGGTLQRRGQMLQRMGVAPARPYVVQSWSGHQGQAGLVAVKGAPEALLPRCALDAAELTRIDREVQRLAGLGLRVLAVAYARGTSLAPGAALPRLEWAGLLGFADPLRKDVPAAIATCRQAGIRVVMITGDAGATAAAIAREAGLDTTRVVSGAELELLDDAALAGLTREVSVFARVSPQHKLRIVRALQAQGHVVAMTGDGVNDAIALRAANIGVAMGRRGTDVAREAAALVLLDDSFAALVHAVRLGRRIFVNLQHSVNYLLAVHVPIVVVSLLPVLFGGPVLLLPLHVVFLELIIDPACSLVFEAAPEAATAMTRPPRAANVRLVSLRGAARALGAGALAALVVAAVQLLGQQLGWGEPWLRLAALGSLVVANLALLLVFLGGRSVRLSTHGNRALGWLLVGLGVSSALVLGIEPLAQRFGFPAGASMAWAAAALLLAAAVLAARLLSGRRHAGAAVAQASP